MTAEVRYIVFTPDEVRSAILTYVQRQGIATTANDVVSVELIGPNEAPAAIVRLQPALTTKPVDIATQYLLAALLLYCVNRRIPIPRSAEKRVELSIDGLTLVMTTDHAQGAPVVASNQVSYGQMANRATHEISAARGELARTVARAIHAESQIARTETRAQKAEADVGRLGGLLTAIALRPGLRGSVGRWLIQFKAPY